MQDNRIKSRKNMKQLADIILFLQEKMLVHFAKTALSFHKKNLLRHTLDEHTMGAYYES